MMTMGEHTLWHKITNVTMLQETRWNIYTYILYMYIYTHVYIYIYIYIYIEIDR